MQRRVIGIVRTLILAVGIPDVIATFNGLPPSNFRAWTYAGSLFG